MKKILLIVYLAVSGFNISAQNISSSNKYEETPDIKNIIFAEAGGNGILLSLNYERLLIGHLGVRTGIGSAGIFGLAVPIMLNYYVWNERMLELGIGVVYTDYFKTGSEELFTNGRFLIAATIGHKYQRKDGGISLRFSFTPFYNPVNKKIIPFGGVSIGYAL